MNQLYIIGNLTRDPELFETANGTKYCRFTLAVNRKFKDSEGKVVTDFLPVTAWRQLGEMCATYLSKGKKVAVVGELQTRTWQDKDGVQKSGIDIIADEIEFLTPKDYTPTESKPTVKTTASQPQNNRNSTASQPQQQSFRADQHMILSDEDLPF